MCTDGDSLHVKYSHVISPKNKVTQFVSKQILLFCVCRWLMLGYGSLGALVFSLYIIYDTQMMMGGKHKYSLSPEEYIFAALNLYLDFIQLFRFILMIVGVSGGGSD